jgi:phage virion morphogenesis protein
VNEGLKIEVEISGFERAARVLDHLSALDIHDLLDQVGETIETQIRYRLKIQKVGPQGEPWPELSPKYEAWKQKHSRGELLELHGKLIDTVQHRVSDDKLEVGSDRDYASAMHFGFVAEGAFAKAISEKYASSVVGGIPARPYMGLSDENVDEIEKVIDAWINKRLAA